MVDMPQPGAAAPDFELPSTQGAIRLSELTGAGKVVLAFYQEDNTPICSSTLLVLKEDYDLVRQLRAEVVAVSADALDAHEEFARRLGGLPFPLASDRDLEAARAYGVLDDGGRRSRPARVALRQGAA